jgi:hypothetical protein
VSILRRDLPGLKIVTTLSDAEVILAFDILSPGVFGSTGGVAEQIAGWGEGCAFRRSAPDGFLSLLYLSTDKQAQETVVGTMFAEAFVRAYRQANPAK